MSHVKKVIEKLNDLLEKNYDTEEGFKSAAEEVKNVKLKAFFEEKAKQRYDFGHELKTEISNFGGKPDKGTSVTGDIHRAWMDLKSALSFDEEEEVLEEAIRGEKVALEEYNEAINEKDLPPSTANLLLKHRNAIEKTLQQVKELEEAFD